MGNAIRAGKRSSSRERGEEPRPEGVRVLVVAKKSRNGDGSQGGQEGGSVKETSRQERPPPVAGVEPEPPQGGEIRAPDGRGWKPACGRHAC